MVLGRLRRISLRVRITWFVLSLVSLAISTTTTTKSSITGFQGVTSFSCNFRPSNDRSKTKTGRIDTAVLMVLGGPPVGDYFGEADSDYSQLRKSSEFETALAIVPPSDKWDRLQRARHYARDPVFREWPPAIRLFHPFDKSPDIAFDIAQLVEDLELEAFEISLDSWVIIPNMEATQREWENQEVLPEVEEEGKMESYYEQLNKDADREVQELIKSEERIGRMKKASKKYVSKKTPPKEETDDDEKKPRKKSPVELRDEQRKLIEDDFGGPCVLCLEPDEESKEKIMELRELLREGLGLSSYSSPSSLYSWEFVGQMDMGYRPLIPISKFDSLKNAMETAQRLKGLWGDPLKIDVKSVDIISCRDPNASDDYDDGAGVGEFESFQITNKEKLFAQQASQYDMNKNAWGCNAKIMLAGEEVEQDDTANEDMISQLLESGEIGGGDISMDFTILDDEEETVSDIEKWLEDDDEFDEGTQVIIGRTHFFTGDQRNYIGMPATSAVDAKDRYLGEAGSVSGLARRRGSISRKSNVWDEGEYGRRTKDHLPWGMHDARSSNRTNSGT